jgi:hypothetical protein
MTTAARRETCYNVCAHFGLLAAGYWQLYGSGYITERGKNVPVFPLDDLASAVVDLVDCELEIVRWEIEHPERFDTKCAIQPARKPKASLHLIPKHRTLGTMGMTEILTGLQLLCGINSSTGNNPTTIAYAEAFEQMFDFSYNSIYDCQSELFKRLPCNLTKTLDAMKTAIIKEKRSRTMANKENDSGGKK